MKRLLFLALFSFACGGSEMPAEDCPTHDSASFELGTGQLEFQPIADGQPLAINSGPQGGCHFFLSLRTNGFAASGFRLHYEVFYAETNASTGSTSSFTARLRPAAESGTCENLGTTAFLLKPWDMEDQRVTIAVDVEDAEGRTASERRTVVADWPSTLDTNACGPRT
jgi:hypothetical protein